LKKILLASESNVFLQRNSSLLTRKQLHLFTAISGAESLMLHKEHDFDLILSDLKLEDMSGCALCAHVRSGDHLPQVPVILICKNIPESIQSVEHCGASEILLKPIEPSKLLWTIGYLIGSELGRSKRVKLTEEVSCKDENKDYICLSHDISNTGILLESEIRSTIGSQITMEFSLHGSCRIETAGKVIRYLNGPKGENRYGVKFIDLPISCHGAIDTYVASMSISGSSTQNINHDDSYTRLHQQNLHTYPVSPTT